MKRLCWKFDASVVDGSSVNEKRCLGRARCPTCFELESRARLLDWSKAASQTDFSVLCQRISEQRVARCAIRSDIHDGHREKPRRKQSCSSFATSNLQRRLTRREDEWSPNFRWIPTIELEFLSLVPINFHSSSTCSTVYGVSRL